MSRPVRELQKRFIVFCEGDTEFHYIDKMRKNQGVQIVLKPINMHGGGYTNFLRQIKMESKSNCLAKFIIVDADRLKYHPGEKDAFIKLTDYCRLQNRNGAVPHFLIVNNPDFEYIACLHDPDYNGQEVVNFLRKTLNFETLDQFKKNPQVYRILNSGNRSYKVLLNKIAGKDKFVKNRYSLKKKNFEMIIHDTEVNWDLEDRKSSNIEEFFNIIDW